MAGSRLLNRYAALETRISDLFQRLIGHLPGLGVDESTLLLGFGVIIGAVVGLAVVLFYQLINVVQTLALNTTLSTGTLGWVAIMGVGLVGLGIARALVVGITNDSDGENIPDVMRAVVKRRGVIRILPVAVKTAAAGITIGAGGAVGAEGPVAVAGSALGSKIGRFFRSGPGRLKVLIACGAAAGISAAFNAPIAGVFFSLEKVMGTMKVNSFPPVLVASVIAAALSRAFFGDNPVILIPTEYAVGGASELVFYAILGVITGLVAVWYTRGTYLAGDLLQKFKSPVAQVLIAAAVIGVLNVAFRSDLWGKGHESLTLEILSERTGWFLIALAGAKLVAIGVTLGATRSGGAFTPALFIGATLGGGLGILATQYVPGFTIEPEAFALVGMAGLVAGATHAPLTAIMMVFEMTSDYALILPLMLTGAIAFITARRLYPESIYSEWLVRKGENITFGQDVSVMERLNVRECYDRNPDVIGESATVAQILQSIGSSGQTEFPVLDADRALVGMITYDDLRTIMSQADALAPIVMAGDMASTDFETVSPDESLLAALQKLAVRGRHHLPVVDPHKPDKLLGLLNRQDLLTAYDRELLRNEDAN